MGLFLVVHNSNYRLPSCCLRKFEGDGFRWVWSRLYILNTRGLYFHVSSSVIVEKELVVAPRLNLNGQFLGCLVTMNRACLINHFLATGSFPMALSMTSQWIWRSIIEKFSVNQQTTEIFILQIQRRIDMLSIYCCSCVIVSVSNFPETPVFCPLPHFVSYLPGFLYGPCPKITQSLISWRSERVVLSWISDYGGQRDCVVWRESRSHTAGSVVFPAVLSIRSFDTKFLARRRSQSQWEDASKLCLLLSISLHLNSHYGSPAARGVVIVPPWLFKITLLYGEILSFQLILSQNH